MRAGFIIALPADPQYTLGCHRGQSTGPAALALTAAPGAH